MTALTRRRFLTLLGAGAGGSAMAGAMSAWGMLPSSAASEPPVLDGSGEGTRVLILGAGLAGMTAAYELGARGYDCTVLEARDRAGGRVYTLRGGTVLHQLGHADHTVPFDEGQWLNPGPWRIPHTHTSVLHYCRQLGVPLEVFNNDNENGWAARSGGDRVRLGTLRADARGHIGELLAKSVGDLDADLDGDDEERLVDFLRSELGLDGDDPTYIGTDARGYDVFPGAGTIEGEVGRPLPLADVLGWAGDVPGAALLGLPDRYFQQTMLHPVGGMDRISMAFEERLSGRIRYGQEVREVRQDDAGVRVVAHDLATSGDVEVEGDYAVVTIPTSVLNRVDGDWSPATRRAFSEIPYFPVGKLGLQTGSRFWETDDQIFGGHSYTDAEIGTISYPSTDYQSTRGVIQAFYVFGGQASELSALSQDERASRAIASASTIHPELPDHVESHASHFWHLERYNLGGWAEHTSESREGAYRHLLEPDGRVYFAGEHLSHLPAWMAGAIESAWKTLEQVHARARQEVTG